MKARRVEGLDPAGALRANISRIVGVRLDELCDLAESALSPESRRAQHDTRIAAKRLRYVLEVFSPCLGEEAERARRAAKRLQSVLGDLHDCDLMLPKVEHVESAARLLRKRRELFFDEFTRQWHSSEPVWSALDRALG